MNRYRRVWKYGIPTECRPVFPNITISVPFFGIFPFCCDTLVKKYPYVLYATCSKHHVQCESKKIPPLRFSEIFSQTVGIFNQFFTHILYEHFFTRLQIFIQLSPTLTKLCHTKRDHPTNFYISLEV